MLVVAIIAFVLAVEVALSRRGLSDDDGERRRHSALMRELRRHDG